MTAVHDRPQPDGSDRRLATAADVPAVTATLARAFENNPATAWTLRNPSTRRGKLEQAWAALMRRVWLPRGECWTTHALDGAALWLPPGRWEVPVGLQLRLMPSVLASARLETPRLMRYLTLVESKHPHEPHWYLAVLGVDPSRQGRGFGSHLMQPVLERCDSDEIPAYLETDTERNVTLYQRHGFEVTEEFNLPGGGPPIWLMWREPR
jgi:ribosomal protein S18 acetylase RimI-like enzyme